MPAVRSGSAVLIRSPAQALVGVAFDNTPAFACWAFLCGLGIVPPTTGEPSSRAVAVRALSGRVRKLLGVVQASASGVAAESLYEGDDVFAHSDSPSGQYAK